MVSVQIDWRVGCLSVLVLVSCWCRCWCSALGAGVLAVVFAVSVRCVCVVGRAELVTNLRCVCVCMLGSIDAIRNRKGCNRLPAHALLRRAMQPARQATQAHAASPPTIDHQKNQEKLGEDTGPA